MAALATEAERDVGARADVIGLDADRLAQRPLGLGVAALPAERDAELVVQVAVVGPQRHRAAERGLGLGVLAERAQRQAPPGVELGVVGSQADGVGVGGRGGGPPALPSIRHGQRRVGGEEARAQPKRLSERGDASSKRPCRSCTTPR